MVNLTYNYNLPQKKGSKGGGSGTLPQVRPFSGRGIAFGYVCICVCVLVRMTSSIIKFGSPTSSLLLLLILGGGGVGGGESERGGVTRNLSRLYVSLKFQRINRKSQRKEKKTYLNVRVLSSHTPPAMAPMIPASTRVSPILPAFSSSP